MKIRPIRNYRTPQYPTMSEARLAPDLLARIPKRWHTSMGFASLLGAGLAVQTLLAGGEETATTPKTLPAAQPKVDPRGGQAAGKEDAARKVQAATALVAPILADAIASDGRGAFGCIAVNPPSFLPEDEALEVIRSELQAVGLKLDEDVAPEALNMSSAAARSEDETAPDAEDKDATDSTPAFDRKPTFKYDPTQETFDLGEKNRSVFIQYLSSQSYRRMERGGRGSSVQVYDFPELAKAVSSSLAQVEPSQKTVFGVFFDPLARAEVAPPDTAGLDPAQTRLATLEYSKAMGSAYGGVKEKAREKLRAQVRYFIAYLRQEGVLGPSK